MKKQTLIRITIIFVLLTQVSHASEVFYLISKKSNFDFFISWVFAISLETSIFLFTMYGKRNIAIFFGVISCLINLISYWFELGWTQNFVAMLLISPIIPITIYFYSELIENENNSKKQKRNRRTKAEIEEKNNENYE
jgi:uncharacterized membrane protein